MLGSTGGLDGSSGEGGSGSSPHESGGGGGGGGELVGRSSIMSAGDEGGSGGGGGGEFYEGDRSSGGNRWPRQETLALLKIRSDMDGVFRDSSLKGPLWEQVSRKMSELGYHRSAKKCKEKFENVYKYHKRTKDGRVGKSEGKTYRFFDQLQALEHHHHSSSSPFPPPRGMQQESAAEAAIPVTMVIPAVAHHHPHHIAAGSHHQQVTVTSSPHPISVVHTPSQQHQMNVLQHRPNPMPVHHSSPIQMENGSSPSATPSSSSLGESDGEDEGEDDVVLGSNRKRKWKDFFERLTKEVINKQEELHKKFLDAVEKRDRDRLARDEAWRAQEIGRLNREHQILVQERSMAAAKDAALMAFLQKLSDQQQIPLPLPIQTQIQTQAQTVPPVTIAATITTPPQTQPLQQSQQTRVNETPISLATPKAMPQPLQQPPPPPTQIAPKQAMVVASTTNNEESHKTNNNGSGSDTQQQASQSRWPKAEVEALIKLRTQLDEKYQESGPKGPLWEEISASMKSIGYNRNAKRCKEKWENINKYFKKVKESNKRRPEDSKTCPYFHQLDALYRGKTPKIESSHSSPQPLQARPDASGSITARPNIQWPGPDQHHHHHHGMEEDDSDDGDDDDGDDDEGSGGYEIVANNNVNAAAAATTTTHNTTRTAE